MLVYVGAPVVAILAGVALALAARHWEGGWRLWAAVTLGVLVFVAEVSWWVTLGVVGIWQPSFGLPLQLCDVAGLIAAVALWWRRPLWAEITWFWGIGGSIQALATPVIADPFPHTTYFTYYVPWVYYVTHGSIIGSALFLVIGLRLYPRAWAVLRMFLLTALWTLAVGLVDFLGVFAAAPACRVGQGAALPRLATCLNPNLWDYMFLRQPPAGNTLLSLLGPWPIYIGTATLVGLVTLVILDLPFWRLRRQRRRAGSGDGAPRPTGAGIGPDPDGAVTGTGQLWEQRSR